MLWNRELIFLLTVIQIRKKLIWFCVGVCWHFFYDDAGNVTDKVCLNPSEGKYGLEIPSNTWHSIIALESGTVIFEFKKGPYQPLPSEDLASWAPQASDVEGIKAFMKRMLEL